MEIVLKNNTNGDFNLIKMFNYSIILHFSRF